MTIRAGNNLFVEVTQEPEKGTPWQVRVYKKVLGFKKRISSDWFLDKDQANKFAERIAKKVQSEVSLEALEHRKPGWVLRPPVK